MLASHDDSDADTSYNRQLKKNMARARAKKYSEASDSSDDEEIDPNQYGIRGLLQKMSTAYARGGGDGFRC